MIRTHQLRKRFDALEAVAGVSFEIAPGETFGLLGPNGAGKTTTIGMLVGLLAPSAGEVEVAGQPDPTQPRVRQQLGVCPQSLSLYNELTGRENLAFFGRLYGLRGRRLRERVEWGLAFAGLADRQRDRVGTYSGGMQRRLNLACALVHEPRILLLDEPTVGVDPQSRNFLFDNIEQLKRDGCTIVYTTHYMEEAQRLCDRVAIMDHGQLLALDTVPALIATHGGGAVIELELQHPPADIATLPGTLEGTHLRIETNDVYRQVAELGRLDLPFVELQVRQPDLETVFLALTGRRLRD